MQLFFIRAYSVAWVSFFFAIPQGRVADILFLSGTKPCHIVALAGIDNDLIGYLLLILPKAVLILHFISVAVLHAFHYRLLLNVLQLPVRLLIFAEQVGVGVHDPLSLCKSHIVKGLDLHPMDIGLVRDAAVGTIYSPWKSGMIVQFYADVTAALRSTEKDLPDAEAQVGLLIPNIMSDGGIHHPDWPAFSSI